MISNHLKKQAKRVLCLFLSILMSANIMFEGLVAFAADGNEFTLMVNGTSAEAANNLTVGWGDPITLSLDGCSGEPSFTYLAYPNENPGIAKWSTLTSGVCTLDVGTYYLGYEVTVGTQYYECAEDVYRLTVAPASVSKATELSWNGTAASWAAVSTTTGGGEITPASYTVRLYSAGNDTPRAELTVGTNTADFSAYLLSNGSSFLGAGSYTFTVEANPQDTAHFLPSGETDKSAPARVVSVTPAKENGISSVTPSTAFYLISTVAGSRTAGISAAVSDADEWAFDKWKASDTGVTFDNSSSASATVGIAADYSGSTDVTVTASAADIGAPSVTAFSAASGSDAKKALTAAASDKGSGLAGYAFTTAASPADVTAWTAYSGASFSGNHNLTASGLYYFHAKDSAGNTASASAPISVSKVTFENTDRAAEYYIGSGSFALPASMTRAGWDFLGWYASSDFSGNAITELLVNNASDVSVYAKWSRQQVDITAQPQSYSAVYDGAAHSLSVTISNTSGTISYQWYKDNSAITGATKSSLSVKNVSDSGSYYVVVTIKDAVGNTVTGTSDTAVVAITKAPLTVTAENKSISYGAAAPTYTYKVDPNGLLGGDAASVVSKGTFSCGYEQGVSVAGQYPITISGFTASNYEINHVPGTLTVAKKNVNAAGSGVVAALADPSAVYIYNGNVQKAAVAVTDGGKTVSADDYTVSYSPAEPKDAGTVTVTVDFSNSQRYTGSLSVQYTIGKQSETPSVVLSGWEYDGTAHTPTVTNYSGTGTPVFWYQTGSSEPVTTAPVNAGTYSVYAVIPATANYESCTTEAVSYTISPRAISLTAPTQTWEFDGLNHTDTNVVVNGSFVGTDGLKICTVNESIINVGSVTSKVSWVLNDTTIAANYSISTVDGMFTVTASKLPAPTGIEWNGDTAGLARWLGASRVGVEVSYKVSLYRVGTETPVSQQTVTDSEYNFADIIRADCALQQQQPGGYYFTVQALSSGGVNAGNYADSDISAQSAKLYTLHLTVTAGTGVQSAQANGGTDVYLMSGETVSLVAAVSAGSSFGDTIWTVSNANASVADPSAASTTITAAALTAGAAAVVTANAENDPADITSFTAALSADLSKVTFTLTAEDASAVTAYMVSSGAAPVSADDERWISCNTRNLNTTVTVEASGTYKAYVKDSDGAITASELPISVYSVTFAPGAPETEVSGSMAGILKLQNEAVTLPACAYTRTGYTFIGWNSNEATFTDQGSYADNANAELTAQWDKQRISFTVNYYVENPETQTWAQTPDSSASFSGDYGAVVTVTDSTIQLPQTTGMTVDTADGHNSSITLTENGLSLNVYYKLNRYKITYTYTPVGASEPVTVTDTYAYGQQVTPREKPTQDGYVFRGWSFGSVGSAPETMPAYDITATGEFVSTATSYDVVFFRENLNGGYDEVSTINTKTVAAIHGTAILADSAAAGSVISSCSYEGAAITYGAKAVGAGGVLVSGVTVSDSANGTVDAANHTYVNYFFKRSTYNISLKIWKDGAVSQTFSSIASMKWGTAITADQIAAWAVYNRSQWTIPEGYMLSDSYDWSTGSTPTTMPSASISINRYLIKDDDVPDYKLEIYLEKAAQGEYDLAATAEFEAEDWGTVTIGSGSGYTIDYTSAAFKSLLVYNDFATQFSHVTTSGSVEQAEVTQGEDAPVLKVYFDRAVKTMTVHYYFTPLNKARQEIYTATFVDRWGTQIDIQQCALLDNGEPTWTVTPSTAGPTSVGAVPGGDYDYTQDFRNMPCTVGYSHSYVLEGKIYSSESNIKTESDLVKTVTRPIGQSGTTISIYYTQVEQPELTYADIQWKWSALNQHASTSYAPLTVEGSDGNTYKIRVASEAYMYSDSAPASGSEHSIYPAQEILEAKWTVGTTLKAGFAHNVTVDGKLYYTENSGSERYLYVLKDGMFSSNKPWFSYSIGTPWGSPSGNPGADYLEGLVAEYAQQHAEDDPKARFVYASYGTYTGTLQKIGNTYGISITYYPTSSIYHTHNGHTCGGHLFRYNQTVTGWDLLCFEDEDFGLPAGKTVAWFLNDAPVGETTSLAMDYSDHVLTGQTTAAILKGEDWAFYRLLRPYKENGLNYAEGKDFKKADITAMEAANVLTVTDMGSTDIHVKNELGVSYPYTITTTKYELNGMLVAVRRDHPALSGTTASLTWQSDDSTPVPFARADFNSFYAEGYSYYESNSNTYPSAPVEGEPVILSAGYTYTWPTLTRSENYKDHLFTPSTVQSHYGKTMTLVTPSEEGYVFTGWLFTKDSGTGTGEVWADAPEWTEGDLSFNMPAFSLTATAQWSKGNVNKTVTHYFQTASGLYTTDLPTDAGTDAQLSFNGTALSSGKAYGNDVYSGTVGGSTLFFVGGVEKSGKIDFTVSELIAMQETVSVEKEAQEDAAEYATDAYAPFSYAYTVATTDSDIVTLHSGESYDPSACVKIEYYYTRAQLSVKAFGASMDGVGGCAQITGTGAYPYGTAVSVSGTAAHGYTVKGWYKADDVCESYDADAGTFTLKEDLETLLSSLTPAANAFTLTENTVLVLLVSPMAAAKPMSMSITGKTAYEYGYAASPDNVLTVAVTMPDGDDGYTRISSYTWYESTDGNNWTELSAAAATYVFPQGKNVGTYYYKCKVTLTRADNGKTVTDESEPVSVNVTKANMAVSALPYNAEYDALPHSISVQATKPAENYTVYYSESAITAANYSSASETPITRTNAGTTKVYFYVHSTDGNYNDYAGSADVTVLPRALTMQPSGIPITKVYDGDTTVKLSNGVSLEDCFVLSGLISGEDADISGALAVYNSEHVNTANALVITGVTVGNSNYALANNSLTVPASITPFSISGSWGTDQFTYDGASHGPVFTPTAGTVYPDEGLTVSTTGTQISAGTYTASAAIANVPEASDYAIASGAAHQYTIAPRQITVTPTAKTLDYDGSEHTLTEFTLSAGSLLSGHSLCDFTSDSAYTDAGEYTVSGTSVKVKNSVGTELTSNYEISFASNTLTINKLHVSVSGGITASDKAYDGQLTAQLDLSGAVFAGVLDGDELSLDPAAVTGSFDTSAAGTNKTVSISYAEGALTGASAKNYILDIAESQSTTTASITGNILSVHIADCNVTYGDTAAFVLSYSGFTGGDTEETVTITGTPVYQVRLSGTQDAYTDYSAKLSAGTYDVKVSGLSAANYTVSWDGTPAKLTVAPRTVTVTANEGSYSRIYDGTTAVTASALAAYYTVNNVCSGDDVQLSFTAAFNSKNVQDANTVNLTDMAVGNSNYVLGSTISSLPGAITPKALTVTAEDKSASYGDAAPAYTYKISGLVSGDSDNHSLQLVSDYDPTDAAKRGAGEYAITYSQNYSDPNYTVTFKPGKLTVGKKTLTVTANDNSITYGDAPAANGVSFSGFVYSEDQSVLTGTPTYTYTYSQYGAAGSYKITPANLNSNNYTLNYADGNLTVSKKDLSISGIAVSSRPYDGTTSALLVLNDAVYDGLLDHDSSYTIAGTALGAMTASGTFAQKNAGENISAALTVNPGSYISARYNVTAQESAQADITKVDATITAEDKTIKYGSAAPDYTVKRTGFVTGETETSDYTGTMFTVSSTYSQNDPVSTYTIAFIGTADFHSTNYNITFYPGTLTVTQNQFAEPVLTWNAGTLSWTESPAVAGVSPSGYQLELFKDGGAEAVYSDTYTGLSADLESVIRSSGAGKYTAKLTVLTSDNTKVENSPTASKDTYAALVTFVYASDAVTAEGSSGCTATIGGSQTGYLVLAGQQDVALNAGLVNGTGYAVKSCSANNAKLTVSGSGISGSAYSGTLKAAADMSVTSAKVTLTLKKNPATLKASIAAYDTPTYFGYPAATPLHNPNPRPYIVVTGTAETGDSYDGYSYTYQWERKDRSTEEWYVVSDASASRFDFTLGQGASAAYRVRCVVTATRADNGESKTVTTEDVTIAVLQADFTSSINPRSGWTYGEARSDLPGVTYNPAGVTIVYLYSADETTAPEDCTTEEPTDAGTWYIRAKLPAKGDYSEYITNPVSYVIAPAQFAAPTDLVLDGISGTASWTAPADIVENNGAGTDSVTVKDYTVCLYREDGGSWVKVDGTTHTTEDCSYDFSDELASCVSSNPGTYTFGVIANSSKETNAASSAEAKADGIHFIDLTASADSVTYGDTVTLAVVGAPAESTFVWYKDGSAVTGRTGESEVIANVPDSGVYSCTVTAGEETLYTVKREVTVTARTVAIEWPTTLSFTYDSKQHDVTPVIAAASIVGSDTVALSVEGNTGTAVGSYTSEIKALTNNELGNYVLPEDGLSQAWAIAACALTDITVTDPDDTVYNGSSQQLKPTLTYGDYTLQENTDYTLSYSANTTDKGTVTITVSAVAGGNFTGSTQSGYEIKAKDIADATITVSIDSQTWTGSPLTPAPALTDTARSSHVMTAEEFSVSGYADNTDVGTASVTIIGIGNYTGSRTENFTINDAGSLNFTVTGYSAAYDGAAHGITHTSVSGATFRYSTDNQTWVTENPSFTNFTNGAQTVYVKASKAGYADTVKSATVNITARSLTVTADDKTVTYGDEAPTYTVSFNGFAQGETEAVLTGAPEYTCAYTAGSPVSGSPYTIELSGSYADANGNYTISYANGKLTVKKAVYDMSGISFAGDTVTYDGQPHSLAVSGTLPTGVTVDYTNNGQTNAGTYTVTASFTSDAANYELIDDMTAELVINQLEAVLEWSGSSFVYNGAPQAPTAVVKNAAAGDTVTVTLTEGSAKTNAGTGYTAEVASLSSTNYKLPENKTKSFDITPAALTVTANAHAIVYGDMPSDNGVEYSGFVTGEDKDDLLGTLNINVDYTQFGNIGDYDIVPSGYEQTTNYSISFVKGTLTVSAKTVELEWSSEALVYNGTSQAPTATVKASSLVNGDTCTVTVTAGAITAGTYRVTATGLSNSNYALPENAWADFTIAQRPLKIKTGNAAGAYTGQPLVCHEWTAADGTSLADGDVIDITYSGSQTEIGWSYNTVSDVAITNAGGTDVKGCYSISYELGKLTVSEAVDTITLNEDLSRGYNGQPIDNPAEENIVRAGTGELGFHYYVAGEGGTYQEVDPPKNAGSYFLKITETADEHFSASESDYIPFTISPAPITITAADASSIRVKEELAALTASVTSGTVYAPDDLEIGAVCEITKTSAAGEYPIVPTCKEDPNYAVTKVNGKYTLKSNVKGKIELTLVTDGNVIAEVLNGDEERLKGFLTAEDLKAVEDGQNVELHLVMSYYDNANVPANDRDLIRQRVETMGVQNLSIGRYLDIHVEKRVGETGEWTNVPTGPELQICITLPNDLRNNARCYVFRSHNGEVTVLNDMDRNSSTVTFATDKFSVYGLGYVSNNDPQYPTNYKGSPRTGDESDLVMWSSVSCISGLTLAAFLVLRRKKENEK